MKINKIAYSFVAGLALLAASCSPEHWCLGSKDVTSDDLIEGSAYSVTVDQTTNTVTMKSLMPTGYQVIWNYDGGSSMDNTVTTQYPFAGKKYVVFGVDTRGGIVYGDTCWININNTNPDLLQGELWTYLTGGVGKSKTWVPDCDENLASKYFVGPLSFYGTADSWETVSGGVTLDKDVYDTWCWNAGVADNLNWIFGTPCTPPAGKMIFDLIGGANVQIIDDNTSTTKTCTYTMDTDNHTMTINGGGILHDPSRDAIVTKWGTIRIMSLTEHTMQLGVVRDNSSEGECYLVYNYIEEGWTPETGVSGTTFTDISDSNNAGDQMTTTTSLTWTLNEDTPYDWYWFDSSNASWKSNGFKSEESYQATTWAPVVAADSIAAFSLYMTKKSVSATEGQYALTNTSGKSFEGSFTADGNWITFDKELTFLKAKKAATSEETDNSWTLTIKGKKARVITVNDNTWLGFPSKQDNNGNITEYVCLELNKKSSSGAAPKIARTISVDNDKVRYGDLEGNGKFRIQFYNCYGSDDSKGEYASITPTDIYCKEYITINFTVSGLGAWDSAESAFVMDSQADLWSASDGVNTFSFKGDGTYEATITGKYMTTSSDLVFLIDVENAQSHVSGIDLNKDLDESHRLKGVTVTINSIKAY